ncbi:MAG: histidinol-phosphatase [Rhodothalassiaceae bacterium]
MHNPTQRQTKGVLTPERIAEFAAFARRLADAAASETLPRFRAPMAVENKDGESGFDPVTEADRAAERVMRELIEATYPEHGILGEEFGEKPSQCGFCWVLDPVDGTRAFIAGLPTWGTLIALNDGSRPVIGLVAQPYIGEIFLGITAGEVRQATLNGRPIRTRPCARLGEAILSTTGIAWFTPAERAAYLALEAETRLVRYGFDCYAYAVLAAGHIDIVAEAGLQPHDVQALIPLVEGAGGIVSDWQGGEAQHGGCILAAGDARVHAGALALLAAAD